jgi:subtilisin family serine protease
VLYPAAEPGVLGVAAVDQNDRKALFSNYNNSPTDLITDIAAPGVSIVSSVPGGGYGSWEGTSMATPFVAGAAALLRALDPQVPASDISRRLVTSAANIDGANPAYAGRLGNGRLNLGFIANQQQPGAYLPLMLRR